MSKSIPSSTQPENEKLIEEIATVLDQWLSEQLTELGVPGAAVAVVDNCNIIWQKVFGYMDHPASPPINSETLFCARSLAKGITALAVLISVQEGLVKLDIPIKKYLPDFTVHSRVDSNPEERITLRHLLAHWASFTHDEPPGNDLDNPKYFQKHIESISDTWLRFPVGYRYAYSNLGFDLAGYILQVQSRMPFAQYVQEKVLDPIGMTSSSFDPQVIERFANRAIGHKLSGQIEPLRFPEIPAAGLYSNVQDMAKYIQFHLNNDKGGDEKLLRPDLMKQFQTIQFARPNQQTGYCFGMWRQLVSTTFSFSHSGGGRGFQSQMIVFPELGFGVILLTNKDGHGLTESPLQKIVDDLVREHFGPNPVYGPEVEGMKKLPPDDPRIQSILGRYWDDNNWTIGVDNGVLGLKISSETFYPLSFYDDEGELIGIYGDSNEIRFKPSFEDQRGTLMSVNWHLLNCNYRALNDSPFDPVGPGKKEWRRYFGDYEVLWDNEPTGTISITQRNGYLYYGEGKCTEYEPGLFFTCGGEAIDFRSDPPTAANLIIRKNKHQSE